MLLYALSKALVRIFLLLIPSAILSICYWVFALASNPVLRKISAIYSSFFTIESFSSIETRESNDTVCFVWCSVFVHCYYIQKHYNLVFMLSSNTKLVLVLFIQNYTKMIAATKKTHLFSH